VTRRAGTFPQPKLSLRTGSLPIWSCSVWGLPCPLHYCIGGALLPHLFTLTPCIRRCTRRYVLCGTSRQPGLNPASRTLSGTLLCGVRTFLPRRRSAESDRPVQLPTTPLYAMCRSSPSRRPLCERSLFAPGSNLNAGLAQPDWLIVAAIERWRNCRLFHLDKSSGETRIASARTAGQIRRGK
jgi:hypothetical protein